MSGQEGHHVSDASARLSTRSGILTPVSDILSNLNDGFGSAGRKRKRDGNTMDDLLKEQFIVKVGSVYLYNLASTKFTSLTLPLPISSLEICSL